MNQVALPKEIDYRTSRLIVGIIALSLPILTSIFANNNIDSISASYYEGGWSQAIFIGFLFASASFLFAYNGYSRPEMILSKIAGVAAIGVALFPCELNEHKEIVPYVHYISAAVMFSILAFFCYGFYVRGKEKGHTRAKLRAAIYAICGITIVLSMVAMAIDKLSGNSISAHFHRLTFYCEAIGLISFGISWLIASRVLPFITRPDEQFSPLRDNNPP